MLAWLLLIIGCIFIADAAFDQKRGVAGAVSPGRGSRYVIASADDPEQFHDLMAYQWLRGPVILFGGFILLGFCRRADRRDPFSPDFAGSDALDELDRTLTEQEENRHRPLR